VIEHITDVQIDTFLKELFYLSEKYVVIQAPYNELDDNNSELTEKNSKGEHVRTLNESMTIRFGNINSDFQWQVFKKSIPYAWDNGKQIFYIGIKK
jgi:hypothetical protein